EVFAEVTGLPLVMEKEYPESSPFNDVISLKFLKGYQAVGVRKEGDGVLVGYHDQSIVPDINLHCR
ncbi:MAG: hypothetical protein DSY87_04815, partial [Methylococcus sp.]